MRNTSARLLLVFGAVFVSWLAVGVLAFALGWGLRGVAVGPPHPVVVAEGRTQPCPVPSAPPAPELLAQPAERDAALPSMEACEAVHGCDCPPPAPPDLDPRYTEDAIEAWIRDVADRCPGFAARELVVSCEEFPCMIGLSIDEEDAMTRSPEVDATCGSSTWPDAPDLVTVANTSLNDDWFVVFAVRPRGLNDHVAREITRARALMGR